MPTLARRLAPLALVALVALPGTADDDISFRRDVRPILAANCLACHGPDDASREAELRLDVREGAVESEAIVPGKPDESELVRRIFSDDPDERMPPADSKHALTDEQKELLRRWVAAGAAYEPHWAFVAPVRPAPPEVKDATWPRNSIDRFVLARLERAGLAPSPEAYRLTLARRVYLDLIGLPPTPEEADAFAADTDPQAYEKLVDRLLASEQYGERWARPWLDLARYADTNGYEKDRPRAIWPYRDWVIRALNDDMPFDRFTIEQLAGDMLPGATESQQIATGFHRNTMLNEEGGIDPLEYRYYAMVDRVATTGTVWLGLTTGCAQCHTHKYDPLTHTDYYRLMALLDNADEPDLIVADSTVAAQRSKLEAQIAELEGKLPEQFPPADGEGDVAERRQKHLEEKFAAWLDAERSRAVSWTVLRPHHVESNLPRLETLDDGSVFSSGDITKRDVYTLRFPTDRVAGPITALRLEALPDDRLPGRGPGRAYYEGRKGDFFLSEVTATLDGRPLKFAAASHSYGKISVGSGSADAKNVVDGNGSTGWSTSGREGERHVLVLNLAEPLAAAGELEIRLLFERHFAASLGRLRLSATSAGGDVQAHAVPTDVERLLAVEQGTLSDGDRGRLRRHFLSVAPELTEVRKPIDALRGRLPKFPTTMVLEERPNDNRRQTHRHHRGEYLSPREEVTPGVPHFLPQLPAEAPADRLALARWLVSGEHPLTARVTVNRAWRAFFGAGLLRTNGDFGTQSEPPTHPELLDWLACEFVAHGWSLKKLHRQIVTSATYRQSSRVTPQLAERDPTNRLLARAARFRVDAEMVRDLMLAASGLLKQKIGGASVYPPQPASVTGLAYGNPKWNTSTGDNRYRRSLYTFGKRTAPFAAYALFDGPSGETCAARRDRSNTPLQALTLLNDAMFLEMARAGAAAAALGVAERRTGGGERRTSNVELRTSNEEVATGIFRRFLTRPPTADELAALLAYHAAQQQRFEKGELDAAAVLAVDAKNTKVDAQRSAASAAWVLVARAIMNLDETITKQ